MLIASFLAFLVERMWLWDGTKHNQNANFMQVITQRILPLPEPGLAFSWAKNYYLHKFLIGADYQPHSEIERSSKDAHQPFGFEETHKGYRFS